MSALDKAKQFIESKGGMFISHTYHTNDSGTKRLMVSYKCANKHLRENIRADSLKTGWCLQCNCNTIEDAQKLAAEHGGKLLSEVYKTCHDAYLWLCKNGHQFWSVYNNVNSGKWCKQCLCYSIEDMKEIARERGGDCLSIHLDCTLDALEWRCKFGHVWNSTGNSIIQGHWCPECNVGISERTCRQILEFLFKKSFPKVRPDWLISLQQTHLELDGFCEALHLAFEYQGKQHFENVQYFKSNLQLLQEHDAYKVQKCAENNVRLLVIPYTVKYLDLYRYIRSLCPEIMSTTPEHINYYTDLHLDGVPLEKLKEIQDYLNVNYPGSKVISKTYLNNYTEMEFLCVKEHTVKQTWSTVRSEKIFCTICNSQSRKRKLVDTKIAEFCKIQKLTLLDDFQSAKTKHDWQCNICDLVINRTWDQLSQANSEIQACKNCRQQMQRSSIQSETVSHSEAVEQID